MTELNDLEYHRWLSGVEASGGIPAVVFKPSGGGLKDNGIANQRLSYQ